MHYGAYGNIVNEYGDKPNDDFRANTKREVYSGLINDGRRHRSPIMCRFLQPDPLEYVDGLNVYLYCNNNPWGRFDPEGLSPYYAQEYNKSCGAAAVRNLLSYMGKKRIGEDYVRESLEQNYKKLLKDNLGLNSTKKHNWDKDGSGLSEAELTLRDHLTKEEGYEVGKVEENKTLDEVVSSIKDNKGSAILSAKGTNKEDPSVRHAIAILKVEDDNITSVDSGEGRAADNKEIEEKTMSKTDFAKKYGNKDFDMILVKKNEDKPKPEEKKKEK